MLTPSFALKWFRQEAIHLLEKNYFTHISYHTESDRQQLFRLSIRLSKCNMNLDQKVTKFPNIEVALADDFVNVLIITTVLHGKVSINTNFLS